MDASTLPKGKSNERTEGKLNLPGVYVHKESGAKFITSDGEGGVVQADALNSPIWKDGWERIGDVPTRLEILEANKAQEVKDAADEALVKGLEAKEKKEAIKKATEEAQAKVDEHKVTEAKAAEASAA